MSNPIREREVGFAPLPGRRGLKNLMEECGALEYALWRMEVKTPRPQMPWARKTALLADEAAGSPIFFSQKSFYLLELLLHFVLFVNSMLLLLHRLWR